MSPAGNNDDTAHWEQAWGIDFRQGKLAAFEAFVSEYSAGIRASITAKLYNSKHLGIDVDDVLQDVLLSIYNAQRQYTPDKKIKPWAHRIAHNATVDSIRKRSRTRKHETTTVEFLQAAGLDPDTHEPSANSFDARDFIEAFRDTLNSQQRLALDALRCPDFLALSQEAMSRFLGYDSKQQYQSAISYLKKLLAQYYQEQTTTDHR